MNKIAKNQLIKKALELFAQKGYSNISVDRLVAECNVSKGLLFYHFKSKENVLKEVINIYAEKLYVLLEFSKESLSAKDKFIILIEKYFHSLIEDYDFWKLYAMLLFEENLKELVYTINTDFFNKYQTLMQSLLGEMYGSYGTNKFLQFELLRRGIYFSYMTSKNNDILLRNKNFLLKQFVID